MTEYIVGPSQAEELGVSSERLAGVCSLIEGWVAQGTIPAAALYVARYGKPILQRGFGRFAPLGGGEGDLRPARPDTIFLIASPTKPVTAMCIALLVERGRLLLDDPVHTLIPEFAGQDRREVRVRHLLTHTSGLPDMLPENVALRQSHAPLSEFVRHICTTPLRFEPGTDCRYQSMGIALLGAIVERLTGMPLRQFIEREFLAPLGMTSSYLGMRQLPRERMAQVALPPEEAHTDWNWNSAYWRDLGAPWGGMHATVEDYGRFLQMLLDEGLYEGRQVLARTTANTALVNHVRAMPNVPESVKLEQAWGLGWRLNQPAGSHHLPELGSPFAFGHAGATGTTAWADPDTGLVCAFFTNQPRAGRLLNLVSNAVAGSVVG